jgi:hypothetical protein
MSSTSFWPSKSCGRRCVSGSLIVRAGAGEERWCGDGEENTDNLPLNHVTDLVQELFGHRDDTANLGRVCVQELEDDGGPTVELPSPLKMQVQVQVQVQVTFTYSRFLQTWLLSEDGPQAADRLAGQS